MSTELAAHAAYCLLEREARRDVLGTLPDPTLVLRGSRGCPTCHVSLADPRIPETVAALLEDPWTSAMAIDGFRRRS